MTSLERILAALAGAPADRRAAAPVLSLYGAGLAGCSLAEYFASAEAYARGQAAVLEAFEPDVVFGPFVFAALGEAFGSQVRYYENQPPNICRPALASAAQWDTLRMPDPDTHPHLLALGDSIRLMAGLKGAVPVCAILPPPIDLPALVLGMDEWMQTVLFDRPAAVRIVESLTPFFTRLANSLFAAGAAFLGMPFAFASPAVVTREIAEHFARPLMSAAMARLQGPVLVHHAGAPILAHLDLLAGLPRAAACVVDSRDDLSRSRQILGPGPLLVSGPMGPNMARLAPDQVRAQCLAMLENRRDDPRFMLCTCGPDVPLNTPPGTIQALRAAVVEFGGML